MTATGGRDDRSKTSGAVAEDAAARALEDAGYRILGRNLRTKGGEIDILATKSGRIAIVEVKARRTGGSAGRGEEALTLSKLRRVARAADSVLRAHGVADRAREFLGVAVDLNSAGHAEAIRIVPVEETP